MEVLTTISGNTIQITSELVEREQPLPTHMDVTIQELLERVETTPWASIAENTAEHSSLSKQQARIRTLESFNISRQLIADLLEVSPNTIDTHKQALQENSKKTEFTETILHGAGYPMSAMSVNLFIHHSPPTVEPAITAERLLFVNHDPVNDNTTYIDRVTTVREKPTEEVKVTGSPSLRSDEYDTIPVSEHSFMEYSDPVVFAFEAMPGNGLLPDQPEAMYEQLCELPVFTMPLDQFTERWEELKEEKAKQTLAS